MPVTIRNTSRKISPRSKTITKAKGKKRAKGYSKKTKKSTKKVESSTSSESETEDSSTTSDSSDTDEETHRLLTLLEESKLKAKMKKAKAGTNMKRTLNGSYEKGECSKRSRTLTSPPCNLEEPRTLLTNGYKGIAAGCSKEGLVDYTLAVMKQYSAKKVSQLREICEKHDIKSTKKGEMVMELVKRQTNLAYEGLFASSGLKKTTVLDNHEKEDYSKSPPETARLTMKTRRMTRSSETPRVVLKTDPANEDDREED
ncbi:hypothetical protein CBR_g61207 [Chara braunii]|uniref:Uncharacterized protein n=1 Tax=Chara braunii TaxID=69332 RepID=A0A388MFH9_CHABU|nr:hypothetical protein CBR_g61207 [Chara braunii]|eukprot:GBG93232.1 hypothetical protein CBR_g61207 [Chara braunii]